MEPSQASFFDSVRKTLPDQVELVDIASKDSKNTEITVKARGVITKVPMVKLHTLAYFHGRPVELTVAEGKLLSEALAELSRKYRLPLEPVVNDQVIVFGDADSFDYQVRVTEKNLAVYGDFTVTFRNSAKCCRCSAVIPSTLLETKIKLAFASTVFKTYDVIVVGGGFKGTLLTDIGDFIRTIPNINPLVLDELMVAEVLDIVDDGISTIAAVELPSTGLLFIRFKFIHASKDPLLKE